MTVIKDQEFGQIVVRRTANSRSMKASVAPNGSLRLSVPSYAPLFMIKRMIASSRDDLRRLLDTRPHIVLQNGMTIGKSHTLLIRSANVQSIKRQGRQLVVSISSEDELTSPAVIEDVRSHIQAILRKEAKAHLPKRISYLADKFEYDFTALRFTHASSRWGSCNNQRAISLNIALMNLPFELIDYVLLHELSHTKHLNHSAAFWEEVEKTDPAYKMHRKILKQYNPGI